MANDTGVLQGIFNIFFTPGRDALGVEALENLAEAVAFAQDGDPAQARLKAVQNQLFPECARVTLGHAPFVVVVIDIERLCSAPTAAFDH